MKLCVIGTQRGSVLPTGHIPTILHTCTLYTVQYFPKFSCKGVGFRERYLLFCFLAHAQFMWSTHIVMNTVHLLLIISLRHTSKAHHIHTTGWPRLSLFVPHTWLTFNQAFQLLIYACICYLCSVHY